MTTTLEPWFIWALVSMLCYGIQSFLNVQLIRSGGDQTIAQAVSPAIVVVGALFAMRGDVAFGGEPVATIITLAVLQGVLYFATTFCRFEALRSGLPAGVVFPLLKMSTIIVVVASAWFLKEWDSLVSRPLRLVGIVLSIVATFFLVRKGGMKSKQSLSTNTSAALLIICGILASAGASLMAKGAFIAAPDMNLFAFIVVSNLITTTFGALRYLGVPRRPAWDAYRRGLEGGLLIGLFNFLGLVAFMSALKEGDLAIVASINSLYVIIPTLIGWGVFYERLSVTKHFAIALTVLAMVFMSF